MPELTGAMEGFLTEVAELEPQDRQRVWTGLRMRFASLLPEEALTASNGSLPTSGPLEVVSLAEEAEDTEPPALLVPGVVPEGQVTWLAGHPAHGKTTIAMYSALTTTRQGRPVLWLDWEGGKRPTARRLKAMGATAEDFRHFHYVPFPRLSADRDGLAAIMGTLDQLGSGALVVFDSASKALTSAGLDENSSVDSTRWTTEVVMPLREAATVVVIDHVVKGETRSTPYARGAGSKLADTEVFWFVEAEEKFYRDRIGRILLTKHKDREGILPERVRFEVGDGQGNLPVKRLEDEGVPGGPNAAVKARAAVLELLRRHDGESLSTRQIEQMVKGKREHVREAAKELAADPSAPVSSSPGERNAVLYKHDVGAAVALDV